MRRGLIDTGRLWRGALRWTLALAAAGALTALAWRDWRWALGYLAGVAGGYLNFSWLHQLVESLDPRPRRARRRLLAFLALRYLLLGACGYVIVKVFGMSAIAVLAGLFVPLAAILFETLFELAHGT
jgi:hypothetical protein